ncbi:MAG: hypothetical protein JWN37_607 [Candidatus Nomurabacteria bacterium]|nr:hypothetical protein [Candidatus Nomurabacteria bacterium]
MKIKDKMAKALFDRGLFEEQAEAVLKQYVESDLGKEMANRMEDDESDYPPTMMTIVGMGVKQTALEWIDANCPKHWARPLFMDAPADFQQALKGAETPSNK